MIVDDFLQREQERGKIGGRGSIVQLDESKFGKRKFNRGRRIEGHWVIGMIENDSEDFRVVVCPDNVRSADVLLPIIQKHVAVGTEIHTDMWRAYSRLNEHGFLHKIVNHSDPEHRFIAEDGTHTQRIEAQWRPAKDWFRERRVPGFRFADTLVEYQWRREVKKNGLDALEQLLSAVKRYYTQK
ncbi:hypothetical protein niasHT_029259 [Heterodera trifolii]|uniref:ISXO2-like transposase domain-containing protein n=1 Tax=Heterodera trifolii TaxID=157864 RepID=A0ABD2JUS8_9BILA